MQYCMARDDVIYYI